MNSTKTSPCFVVCFSAMLLLLPMLARQSVAANRVALTVDVPHTIVTPKVDADPSDPAWPSSAVIPSLSLCSDAPAGNFPTLQTTVSLQWDGAWLYVRYNCSGSDIYSESVNHLSAPYKADVVETFIDPVGDARQYSEFEVGPDGSSLALTHLITADPVSDSRGMLIWSIASRNLWHVPDVVIPTRRCAARIVGGPANDREWIVDMAIPATLLKRLGEKQFSDGLKMRANFLRYNYCYTETGPGRKFAAYNWAPVVWGCPHLCPQAMGYLTLTSSN